VALSRLWLLVCVAWVPLAAVGCKARTPAITEPFSDDFERGEVGASWLDTSGHAQVHGGQLVIQEGRNHPIWLRKRLPGDVVVEADMMSRSPDGDLKLELFGDGESFDPDEGTYNPTGYVFAFGGWKNSLSIIGKLGEHEDGVKVSRPHRGPPSEAAGLDGGVLPGRTYHFTITRKGGQIDWKIDGQPFLSWNDPEPLTGEKHEYLAVTNWQAEVHVDKLTIRPAP
jgi:hypothetical protein